VKRIRIIHKLRTAVALLGFLAVLAAGGVLWWANHTGLPDAWRSEIEQALARHGLHADVASLRWAPLRGIEASEVVVYSDDSRARVVAKLHELVFDVDRSRLAAGDIRLDRLDLTGARIALAADPADPRSKELVITDARGRVHLSDQRRLEIHDASGMVGGIRLEVEAELLNHRPGLRTSPEDLERKREERRRIITRVIELLGHWGPHEGSPLTMRIEADADLDDPESYRATIRVRGSGTRSVDLPIDAIDLRAEIRGDTIVVQELSVSTPEGRAAGRAEYDLGDRAGRFELRSELDPEGVFVALRLPLPEEFPSFGSSPELEANGRFEHAGDGWRHHVIGHVRMDAPSFRHLEADRLETSFSWDGSRLFLEDLVVEDDGGRLAGRVFIAPERIRYQAETTLPLPFWQRAVTIQPLSDILDDFSAPPGSEVSLRCEGEANPERPADWRFAGTAEARRLAFRGVPARRAKVTMDLDHEKLDFTAGEVEFDYTDYALRKAHGGPAGGSLEVGRIRYDRKPSTVTIAGLRGDAWPAPVVRTFAPGVADSLESYGFHRTPSLRAAGVIGIGRGLPRQNLLVSFESAAPAGYRFLDAGLVLDSPRGDVRILPDRVRVGDLSFGVFDGLVRAEFEAETRRGGTIEGEIDWTGLSLPQLARAYAFNSRPQGRITGRMDFAQKGERTTGLDGRGHLALTGGELFEVPIFGPLSPVISAVLGRRKAGFQEAEDAFFSFAVDRGVVRTADFLTTTSSLVFTGDGTADLNRKTLEMTIRMNARGLLGVLTLPLRPFYGLFQFRGTGPIEKPEWKNVAFTSPPKDQEAVLLDPPKARAVEAPVEPPPRARPVAPRR